jgi:DNA-binding CsgD family transcriptional regulator
MQIAVALGVSDKTIDNHRTKIRKKLALDRRTRLDSFLLSL